MTLNERLQFYRKRDGLSQEELAAALSVTRQAVSKWETGAAVPDLETLKVIFGCINKLFCFL